VWTSMNVCALLSSHSCLQVSFERPREINVCSSDEPSVAQFFKAFESGVKNQCIAIERFQKQGPKEGKVSSEK